MRSLGRSLIIFFAIVGVSGICYQIPHLPMEQETLFYLGDLAHWIKICLQIQIPHIDTVNLFRGAGVSVAGFYESLRTFFGPFRRSLSNYRSRPQCFGLRGACPSARAGGGAPVRCFCAFGRTFLGFRSDSVQQPHSAMQPRCSLALWLRSYTHAPLARWCQPPVSSAWLPWSRSTPSTRSADLLARLSTRWPPRIPSSRLVCPSPKG